MLTGSFDPWEPICSICRIVSLYLCFIALMYDGELEGVAEVVSASFDATRMRFNHDIRSLSAVNRSDVQSIATLVGVASR
jgi:hypothetical protein